MRAHLRSNAIAYLALFLALTGTAVALPGTNTVFSDDITNGEVRSQDIAQEAVHAEDIDPIAFAPTDFKAPKGLANFFQIRDGAIQGSEIQNGQVTGGDVAGNSIARADLAASAEAPAGFSFSDETTGIICNDLCTEGTLGSIPAGSYAVFGKIGLVQNDVTEDGLGVFCELSSSGQAFDEARVELDRDVLGPQIIGQVTLQGFRTFDRTGDVSINCADGDTGDVRGRDLKIVAIRLGTVD